MAHKRNGLTRPSISGASFTLNAPPVSAVVSPVADSTYDVFSISRPVSGTAGLILLASQLGIGVGTATTLPFWHKRPWTFAWNRQFYVLPGPYAQWIPSALAQAPLYVTNLPSSSAVATYFGGTGNEGFYPSVVCAYKQRLVYANFGLGYENSISFTDNYSATTIANDALAGNSRGNIALVSGNDGDEIVGMVEVMLTGVGDPAQSALLILRRFGNPFLLTGEPEQSSGTPASTLDIKRISINAGCAGPYTIAKTPVGIVWAGQDDVWGFGAGQVPVKIGTKIQPEMANTPPEHQAMWTGVYHNGFYRLAIWGEGQPIGVGNAPGNQWWLDLRDGLPNNWEAAKWWGPQQYLGGAAADTAPVPQTWVMFPETRAGKQSKLYYADYTEGGSGATTVIGEYGLGNDSRDLTSPVVAIADADYVDPEITCEIVTKEYDVAPTYEKGSDGVRLTVRPDNFCGLELDIVTDAGDQSQTVDKLVVPGQFQVNKDNLDTGLITNVKPCAVSLYAEAGNRPVGQTFQFRIRDVAGYVIEEGVNDTLIVRINIETSPGIYTPYTWLATIADGNYTRNELIDALTTAINAARIAGPVWTISSYTPLEWEIDNTPTNCRAVLIAITPLVDEPSGITPTDGQVLSSMRLIAMLGFAYNSLPHNGVVGSLGTISNLTATDTMFRKAVSNYDIWGISANIEVFPREP